MNIKLITVCSRPEHAGMLVRSYNHKNMMCYAELENGVYKLVRQSDISKPRYRSLPIICGIYEIISPTGKVYVGQSRNIFKRWAVYRNIKCKDQRAIYNSLVRYGSENHIFKIVKEFDILSTQLELDEYEKNRISLNLSRGIELLNLTIGGFSTTYCTESRRIMSESKKGKTKHLSAYWKGRTGILHHSFGSKKTDEQKLRQSNYMKEKFKEITNEKIIKKEQYSHNYWKNIRPLKNLEVFAKPVVQLTMDGEFLREWESTAMIERELGICHRTIKKYCLGIPVRYGKHNFKYKSDYEYKTDNSLLAS